MAQFVIGGTGTWVNSTTVSLTDPPTGAFVALCLLFKRPMFGSPLRLIFIAALMALSGCGQGFVASVGTAPDMTGARNKDGLEYTGASDSNELEVLKQAIDPTPAANMSLAASIEAAAVNRLDGSGHATTSAPAQIEIQLKLQGHSQPLVYRGGLTSTGASREARALSAPDSDLKLNARCLDPDCGSVEIRMGNGKSEAGLISRLRHVKAEALGPFSTNPKTVRLAHVGQIVSGSTDPVLVTTEVAWGPSTFELRAGDLTASGDLVATGTEQTSLSIVVKGEAPLQARLLGNSNHGDLLLRLTEGPSWSFIRVRLPERAKPTTPIAIDDETVSTADRFIPFDLKNPITAVFQQDKSNPVIQDAIQMFRTGTRGRDLVSFLNRIRPSLSALLPTFASQGVPPEFIFIALIESNYFVSPGFPVSVSEPGAVGPWQFMPETAKTFGLKTLPTWTTIVKNKAGKNVKRFHANDCDERADIVKSTRAAATYFRKLLNMFPNDPKLAVMAYNLGENGLGRQLRKVKCGADPNCPKASKRLEIADFAGLDYWDVRDFNVAPRESIAYVPRFLGAQFVGREPSRYGISVATSGFEVAPSLPANCR